MSFPMLCFLLCERCTSETFTERIKKLTSMHLSSWNESHFFVVPFSMWIFFVKCLVRKWCFPNLKISISLHFVPLRIKEHDFDLASEVIPSWSRESWFLGTCQKYIAIYTFIIEQMKTIKYYLSRNKAPVICY